MTPAAAACEDQITLTQIVRGKKPSDTTAASTKYETEEANNEGITVGCLWLTSVNHGYMLFLVDRHKYVLYIAE